MRSTNGTVPYQDTVASARVFSAALKRLENREAAEVASPPCRTEVQVARPLVPYRTCAQSSFECSHRGACKPNRRWCDRYRLDTADAYPTKRGVRANDPKTHGRLKPYASPTRRSSSPVSIPGGLDSRHHGTVGRLSGTLRLTTESSEHNDRQATATRTAGASRVVNMGFVQRQRSTRILGTGVLTPPRALPRPRAR